MTKHSTARRPSLRTSVSVLALALAGAAATAVPSLLHAQSAPFTGVAPPAAPLHGPVAMVNPTAPPVVVVEPSLAARAAMAVAGLGIPPGLLLSFLSADESAPLGRSAEAPLALVCLGVALFVAGVYALLRGTVRACRRSVAASA